jgi:hypothetical protein
MTDTYPCSDGGDFLQVVGAAALCNAVLAASLEFEPLQSEPETDKCGEASASEWLSE